ncbi:MAG: ImmA/IrrE family metallo-endopeptidase [Planctomycetota bacterium]
MVEFKASFLSIDPNELVGFLLTETGQLERDAVNPADLLSWLNLQHTSFDFTAELPREVTAQTSPLRALLSFPDRLVATDAGLHPRRTRFSIFHEIAHFVLPNHEHALYLDSEECLSARSSVRLEQEANEFASSLMFKGDQFTLEANSHPISAASVKALADRYQNSFESTCRRFVERNLRPALLAVFHEPATSGCVDVDEERVWQVRYCVTSPTFRNTYFTSIEGVVPHEAAQELTTPGRDIADSIVAEALVAGPNGSSSPFRLEFFSNSFSIFCLLTPP